MTIKEILIAILKVVGKVGNYLNVLPRFILIRMDGGICSQIHFYLVGKILENKGSIVKYDLDWFDDFGIDCDGIKNRAYNLDKLFPNIEIKVCKSRIIRKIYKFAFNFRSDYFDLSSKDNWYDILPPTYLSGYHRDREEMYSLLRSDEFDFTEAHVGKIALNKLNEIKMCERKSYSACSVHVRRGDLSSYMEAYGHPTQLEYFKRSMLEILGIYPDTRFYIFSDDPEWCRENFDWLNYIPHWDIVDINDPIDGWKDLVLMANCRHQITSQGSMGKYAALLRPDGLTDGMVYLSDNPECEAWKNRFTNAKILKVQVNKP